MSENQTKCECCGYFICANRHKATKSDTCPDVIPTPTSEEKQDWCGYCGRTNVEVRQWNQGATSTLLCTKCVEKKEECAKLAQQTSATASHIRNDVCDERRRCEKHATYRRTSDMSYFHRFVSTLVTKSGTKYTKVLWGTGRCDITIKGVTFRNMSVEEENYLHFIF